MRKKINKTDVIFPMPVLMIATYNEDGAVDVSKLHAITFDPYTHGYYEIGERVGEAFKDGLKLK